MWKLSKPRPPVKAEGPYCPVYYSWTRVGNKIVWRMHRSMFGPNYVVRSK